MKKQPTVAIYSGVSVSTTFIERLIKGLANVDTTIYIFGAASGTIERHKHIRYVIYGKKLHKLFILLKYYTLLALFKTKEKKALDAIIKTKHKGSYLWRLKYYSVLYHKPDVFHIQWAKGLDDWMWVQDFGMKLVLSLRGAHINYSPIVDLELATMYRRHFSKVNGFHAVSEALAKEATKYGAPIETIKVIKSGLNFKEFPFHLKAFNSKSTLNIISVGRDHWKKNYRLALDVMFKLKQLQIPFSYRIVGVSTNESLLFQRAQLGLEDEVCFIDALPFKEVQEAIVEADVMLLPSVEEGIANVVLEAMALGTLVVSTDCGGMKEVVLPKQTGYLVPVRDAHSMALALKEVSELSTEKYQNITQQARSFIEKYHNEEQMVSRMQKLYESLN